MPLTSLSCSRLSLSSLTSLSPMPLAPLFCSHSHFTQAHMSQPLIWSTSHHHGSRLSLSRSRRLSLFSSLFSVSPSQYRSPPPFVLCFIWYLDYFSFSFAFDWNLLILFLSFVSPLFTLTSICDLVLSASSSSFFHFSRLHLRFSIHVLCLQIFNQFSDFIGNFSH